MVASNPLFSRRWTLERFQATVINDIWPEVAFFSLVATMVSLVSRKTTHNLSLPTTLLTVLGTVLGLVISFRTSSAYERYQDGRKMWTNIMTGSRNLASMFWVHVSNTRETKGTQVKQTELESIIEKKTMINLLQAFSVSVKHFLRDEHGPYYEDLYPLVCVLPRVINAAEHTPLPLWYEEDAPSAPALSSLGKSLSAEETQSGDAAHSPPRRRTGGSDLEKALPDIASERPLKPSRSPPVTTIYNYIPLLRFIKWCIRAMLHRARPGEGRRRKLKTLSDVVQSHIPLEILLYLNSYTMFLMESGLLHPSIANSVTTNMNLLSDSLSNLERICNTPLPFAYQAHLRMTLWLYLFFLPFQIYSTFGYLTIPGTAFTAFLLLGFLEIGQEIENPFNYDLNDLDLDLFCATIARELNQITAHPAPLPSEFLFTAYNQPFAPSDRRTADILVREGTYETPDKTAAPGKASVQLSLVRGWQQISQLTQ